MPSPSAATRVSGPADLAPLVPYLLGFHPAESVVLVGMSAGRPARVGLTARLDIACSELAAGTVPALLDSGAASVLVLGYSADPARAREAALAAGDALSESPLRVADVVAVSGGRVVPLACQDPACCPPEGWPLATATAGVATAILSGVAPLADRDSVADSLAPCPTVAPALLADLATYSASGHLAAYADVAALVTHSGPACESVADRAAVGAALRDIAYRDSVWTALDRVAVDRVAAAGRPVSIGRVADRWADLARSLPAPYSAAPYFLAGWAYWRAGDGLRASLCCDLADRADPGYSAARLLADAVGAGCDPRGIPCLA